MLVRHQGLCCQALPLPPGLGYLYIVLDLKLLEFVGNGILGLCPLRFVTEDEFNYVTLIRMALSLPAPTWLSVINHFRVLTAMNKIITVQDVQPAQHTEISVCPL